MPFSGTRQDVSNVVLAVIQAIESGRNITIVEATVFGQDLIVDKLARRSYATHILNRFEQTFPESRLLRFGPDTCANAGKVKDIVNAIWDEVKPV